MDLRGFSSKWSASYQKLVSGLFSHRPCRSVPRWRRCRDQIERISFHAGSEGTLDVRVNTFDLEENANHSLFLIKKDSRSVTPKQPSGPRNLEGWFSGRSCTPPCHSNNQLLLPSGPLSSWKDGKYGQHLDTGQLHVHVPSQPPPQPRAPRRDWGAAPGCSSPSFPREHSHRESSYGQVPFASKEFNSLQSFRAILFYWKLAGNQLTIMTCEEKIRSDCLFCTRVVQAESMLNMA